MERKLFTPETRQIARERLAEKFKNKTDVKNGHSERQRWNVYDRELEDFAGTFKGLTDNTEGPYKDYEMADRLQRYIEYVLDPDHTRRGSLIATEFGGPASNLFASFSKDFFETTFGICLNDERDSYQKRIDAKAHHQVLSGDIWNTATYQKLRNELGGRKIDLIFSRMVGPLNNITRNPHLWAWIGKRWYELLNTNGLLFVQYAYTSEAEAFMLRWIAFLQKEHPELEVTKNKTAFKLHKTSTAPEELPFLPDL